MDNATIYFQIRNISPVFGDDYGDWDDILTFIGIHAQVKLNVLVSQLTIDYGLWSVLDKEYQFNWGYIVKLAIHTMAVRSKLYVCGFF